MCILGAVDELSRHVMLLTVLKVIEENVIEIVGTNVLCHV